MFSPGTKPFMSACFSLYGRTEALNNEEVQRVIGVVKARKVFVSGSNGDYKSACLDAYGFTSPFELMDGDK